MNWQNCNAGTLNTYQKRPDNILSSQPLTNLDMYRGNYDSSKIVDDGLQVTLTPSKNKDTSNSCTIIRNARGMYG